MKPVVSLAQQSVLSASRMKVWEPIFWLLALASPWIAQQHALIINEIAIVALFAVSLDLVLGYTGIVSLGHAAFFGVGAYTAGLLASHGWGEPLSGLGAAGNSSAPRGWAPLENSLAPCSCAVSASATLSRAHPMGDIPQ